tara:strand:+ start:88 stop:237 length:150 start_codon:yes stop_codon:yes gene_type:complete
MMIGMLANLDVDLRRTFVTTADSGNFTCTGGEFWRMQLAIRQQIKRLEA